MKLLISDYQVNLVNDNMQEFVVTFNGPLESESALISLNIDRVN